MIDEDEEIVEEETPFIERLVLVDPALPEVVKTALSEGTAPIEDPELVEEKEVSTKRDIRAEINDMGISQRLKVAMFGNSICRRLLILDPNRMIQEAVLNNPKLTMPEIEDFAKSTSVDKQVLRFISARQSWVRNYHVKAGLVFNPKSPIDLSIKWMKFLNKNDVKKLARSKSVPQVLVVAAKKKMQDGAE